MKPAPKVPKLELQRLVDALPSYIIVLGPQGSRLYANRAALDYHGISLGEWQAEDFPARFIHPADLVQVISARKNALAKELPLEIEARLLGKNGEYRWFLGHTTPQRDDQGRIIWWYAAFTDIEHRKQAEEKALNAERESRLVNDTAPALIHTSLPDGSIDYFSKRWLDYLGSPLDEIKDWRWTSKIHCEDVDAFVEKCRSSLRTGGPFEAEARVRRADGMYRCLLHRNVPLRDDQGNIIKWYGSSIDIEDRKRAEEALQEARAELARVTCVTTMGELAASIAHEVNQPLAGVVTSAGACLNWLANQPPNLPKAREATERILRDGTRAGEILTRIRTLLKRAPPAKSKVRVNQIISDVVALARSELQQNNVELYMELDSHLPTIMGDSVQLQQVLLNLVMNAIEAMTGTENRRRTLRIQSGPGNLDGKAAVSVKVCDTGIGFSAADVGRLFEAFYTTKPEGMGMGLWISRSVVEGHSGRLTAQPNDGPGVTFQMLFPAETIDPK